MTSLNLNGKLWSNSDSVGKKLIQKLGWAQGDGLGKNKQGALSHVKVSLKNNRDGIGMKSDKPNNCGLLQTFDYDMLLKSKYAEINGDKVIEIAPKSMSRAKFGRAVRPDYFKPLNNDDWTNILGKSVNISENTKEKNNQNEDYQNTEIDSKFVTKKINVNDYFENQMKLKMEKLRGIKDDNSLTNNESINEQYVENNNQNTEIDTKFVTKKINVNDYFENQMKRKMEKLGGIKDDNDSLSSPTIKRLKFEEGQGNDNEEIKYDNVEIDQQLNLKEETIIENEVCIIENKKNKTTKSKKTDKIEKNVDEEIIEEAIIENLEMKHVEDCNVVTLKNMKRKRKSVNLTDRLNILIDNSKIKMSEVNTLLNNEPIESENNKKISIAKELFDNATKNEIIKERKSIREMPPLIISNENFTSPLDSSNIKDIKGYKYY